LTTGDDILDSMVDETTKRLFTVKAACTYLSISRTTLYRMIEQKEIPIVNIGGRTLFDKEDLDRLIEESKSSISKKRVKRSRSTT
jgi:excisionase family DNA binding protein